MVPRRDGGGGAARLLLVLGLALGFLACVGRAVGSPGWRGEVPPPTATPRLLLQRGAYATADESDPAALAWAGKFAIVEVGGVQEPPPPPVAASLRAAGVRTLLLYDWMPATYHYTDGSADDPLTAWAYAHRYTATLNPEGPHPHCAESGYDWCEDFYFDLGEPEVLARRVDFLVAQLRASGYDGLFFDWASGAYLDDDPAYAVLSETWRTRHPDRPYAAAVGDFYAALRAAMPTMTLVTNQGFRRAAYVLPWVNLDMTESYVTTDARFTRTLYVEGRGPITVPQTVYYPVSEDPFHGTLSDTMAYLDELAALRARYGGPSLRATLYLNYAAPDYRPTGAVVGGHVVYTATVPRAALYFAYAVPKLLDQMAYTEVPEDHRLERDDLYFYALGAPLGEGYERLSGGYLRYFTRGIVLVGAWQEPITLTLRSSFIPRDVPFYDAFERRWGRTGDGAMTVTVQPRPDPLTGRMAPSGRLYLYALPTRLYLPVLLRTSPPGR